ncbi:MAG TPA: Phenylacetic acid catabolic protein [Candidatus Binataceae bacterium]|nr:Phenylacetic acid catabolic protein [Candidatus Binataceae bacterium]
MTASRYASLAIEADDIAAGRVEPHYVKVLTRLLAAHALAEKFTAIGYQRALETIDDARLRPRIAQNYAEERKHARLVYQLLEPLGLQEAAADRSLIAALKAPSFVAPRYFAEHAEGPLDLVMGSVSLDMTGYLMIGVNYRESSYAPHARAADLILEEEAGHEDFAASCLRDAVEWFGAERVNGALRAWLPRAVNFFGPPGSGFTFDCIRYGLKQRDNGELADLFLAMLERRVVQAGLAMPALTSGYPRTLG